MSILLVVRGDPIHPLGMNCFFLPVLKQNDFQCLNCTFSHVSSVHLCWCELVVHFAFFDVLFVLHGCFIVQSLCFWWQSSFFQALHCVIMCPWKFFFCSVLHWTNQCTVGVTVAQHKCTLVASSGSHWKFSCLICSTQTCFFNSCKVQVCLFIVCLLLGVQSFFFCLALFCFFLLGFFDLSCHVHVTFVCCDVFLDAFVDSLCCQSGPRCQTS